MVTVQEIMTWDRKLTQNGNQGSEINGWNFHIQAGL